MEELSKEGMWLIFAALLALLSVVLLAFTMTDVLNDWISQPARERTFEKTIQEVCVDNTCRSNTATAVASTSSGTHDLCDPKFVGTDTCFGLCGKYYCEHKEVTSDQYVYNSCAIEEGLNSVTNC